MNSYFLCVTQPFNAGDLLINRMLIEELSCYGKVFVDCYNCPDDFRIPLVGNSDNVVDVYKSYGFTLKRGGLLQFVKFAKENDVRLYTQSPGPLNRIGSLPLRFSFAAIRATLVLLKIPFVRIGNCCSAAIVKNVNVIENDNVHYYVRSKKAVDYLRKFRENDIHYIPDLAFLYKRYVRSVEKKQRTAILSFRPVTENFDQFFLWLRKCIAFLKSRNYHLVYYYQVKKDKEFMQKLYDLIGDNGIELRRDVVWYDDFEFYSDKEIVISNRLHCLLMGAVYGTVPFAYLDKGMLVRKIQDVFESSFGTSYTDYITDFTSTEKLEKLIGDKIKHKSYIDNIVVSNEQCCRSTIKDIVEKFE